jgi:hypothetical protein
MKLYFSFFVLVFLFAAVKHWPPENNGEHTLLPPEDSDPVKVVHREKARKVDVMMGDELFTSYIYPENLEKPVLFPVNAPGNLGLTRGFPLAPRPFERVDHPHHLGLWFNYGDVNGLDFWNNSYRVPEDRKHHYGHIRHEKVLHTENGKAGKLETHSVWLSPEGEKLLDEFTTFVFRQEGKLRIIDRLTRLRSAGQEVRFDDNKEGMLAIRVARQLELPSDKPVLLTDASGKPAPDKALNNENVSGDYLSSEGLRGTDVWGTRARWMKLEGTMDGQQAGIAIIDHPENPGYPTYWHARPYGLFAANPLGQQVFSKGEEELHFKLAPGEEAAFNYRIVVSSGVNLDRQRLNKLADGFAENKISG